MLRLATIILSLIGLISGQSIIVAYSDANCQVPIRNLVGSFDGICQSTLAGAGSFKITQLDPSCVGKSLIFNIFRCGTLSLTSANLYV